MKVCLVGYSFYESDNRKLRSARALAERGDHVDVIALRRDGQPAFERVEGVNVYRVQRRKRNERGPFAYLSRLGLFLVRSCWRLSCLHLKHRYDLVQVHSVPDFEVFAAWLPKLCGAKVLLDIYDISPEFYLSKFGVDRTAPVYRLLVRIERAACRFADHVIAANDLWQKLLISRSVPADRCSVFINYLDPRVFYPHERRRKDSRFVMLYPGVLNWHQGVDLAIRAFAKVRAQLPQAEFVIHGDGGERPRLMELAESLGVREHVMFKDVVPLADVPQIMADADVGVVAKRVDVFGNEAYSTKIIEFMSQGVPVVVSGTKIDRHYFDDSVVRFFTPEDPDDLAEAILSVARGAELRERLVRNGRAYAARFSWAEKKKDYLAVVERLVRAER